MGKITEANIWKTGTVRSVSSLFSSNGRAITCVIVSETGIVSKETFKMAIGYCVKNNQDVKAAWLAIQKLMMPMEGCDTLVLPISERSYIPLDPLGRLDETDKLNLIPLTSIATGQYDAAFTRVTQENKKSANSRLLTTMVTLGGVITCIALLISFFRR